MDDHDIPFLVVWKYLESDMGQDGVDGGGVDGDGGTDACLMYQ